MLRIRTLPEQTVSAQVIAGANKTQGQHDIVNGKYGFWHEATLSGELGTFITECPMVLVDLDPAATYNALDTVYEHASVPTGQLNKTSTSRTAVGYLLQSYPAGSTQGLIRYTGGNI